MLSRSILAAKKNTFSHSSMALYNSQLRSVSSHLKAFATIDPDNLSASKDKGYNLVNGEWVEPS